MDTPISTLQRDERVNRLKIGQFVTEHELFKKFYHDTAKMWGDYNNSRGENYLRELEYNFQLHI